MASTTCDECAGPASTSSPYFPVCSAACREERARRAASRARSGGRPRSTGNLKGVR